MKQYLFSYYSFSISFIYIQHEVNLND